jgi:hypothetical protein
MESRPAATLGSLERSAAGRLKCVDLARKLPWRDNIPDGQWSRSVWGFINQLFGI